MQKTDQLGKALVINSDPRIRRFLEDILNEHGYQVRGVEEMHKAVQLFKAEDFSLVISELELPGFEGVEILDLVRRFRSKAKVVLITPDVGAEVYIKARALGAFDCIGHSLEKSALTGIIAAASN